MGCSEVKMWVECGVWSVEVLLLQLLLDIVIWITISVLLAIGLRQHSLLREHQDQQQRLDSDRLAAAKKEKTLLTRQHARGLAQAPPRRPWMLGGTLDKCPTNDYFPEMPPALACL